MESYLGIPINSTAGLRNSDGIHSAKGSRVNSQADLPVNNLNRGKLNFYGEAVAVARDANWQMS